MCGFASNIDSLGKQQTDGKPHLFLCDLVTSCGQSQEHWEISMNVLSHPGRRVVKWGLEVK